MKKMLAKAVVLGLVLGGIGFVANDAQAAKITDGVKVFSAKNVVLPEFCGRISRLHQCRPCIRRRRWIR